MKSEEDVESLQADLNKLYDWGQNQKYGVQWKQISSGQMDIMMT